LQLDPHEHPDLQLHPFSHLSQVLQHEQFLQSHPDLQLQLLSLQFGQVIGGCVLVMMCVMVFQGVSLVEAICVTLMPGDSDTRRNTHWSV